MSVNEHWAAGLKSLAERGRIRQLRPLAGRERARLKWQGREMLNLSSNDYLGFAGDEQLHQEFFAGLVQQGLLDRFGLGAASSRLLTGDCPAATEVEQELCRAYAKDACLLFNSGYHANIGILPALYGKGDLILSDKLNHASITDGLRLASATHKRYAHVDYSQLHTILTREREKYRHVVIVSESVFSMDGDVADLRELVRLKEHFDCQLYIDDAHGVGVYGEKGLGMAEAQGVIQDIDMLVGTFGKAFASIGAYLLCSELIRDYLINHSRSLIFTTALPPITHSWNHFILRKVFLGHERRRHLETISVLVRNRISELGLETRGTTNIIPVLLGEDHLAVDIAADLQEAGYLVLPVRPPTVPENSSRLRISLTSDMDLEELMGFITCLAKAVIARMPGKQRGS